MLGSSKQAVLDMLSRLPDDVSVEEIMEALLLYMKVEQGRQQIRVGETLTHEQVRHELRRWCN